jgi:MFS family permease
MLAPFLISPLAGVLADRYNRKWLLILTDIIRAITVFGFLFVREPEHVWLLYVLTAVQLGIGGVFFPTRNAILPDLVSPNELGAANALSSATWSVMLALGAALGGIVAGSWGVYPAFVIDGITFLVSAVVLLRIKYRQPPSVDGGEMSVARAIQQYVYGLRYLLDRRDVLRVALLKGAMALSVSGAYQVIQVRIAEQIFPIGEGGGISLGLIYAVVGVGTGLGPIIARRFSGDRDRSLRIAIAVSYAIAALGLAAVATLESFGVVLAGTLLRGIGVGINWVFSTQLLLQLVPEHVRGRVFSSEYAMVTLMNAIGAALGGGGVDHPSFGIERILWIMVGLTLVFGIFWVTGGMSVVKGSDPKPASHD